MVVWVVYFVDFFVVICNSCHRRRRLCRFRCCWWTKTGFAHFWSLPPGPFWATGCLLFYAHLNGNHADMTSQVMLRMSLSMTKLIPGAFPSLHLAQTCANYPIVSMKTHKHTHTLRVYKKNNIYIYTYNIIEHTHIYICMYDYVCIHIKKYNIIMHYLITCIHLI